MRLAQGIEVYTITSTDILLMFGLFAGVVFLAVVVTWMVLSGSPVADDPEETVEIRRPRGARRRPHTGIRHEAAQTVDLSKVAGGDRRG